MPWKYEQSTGKLFDPTGDWIATGYSGHGADINKPAAEAVAGMGPIPHGFYSIGAAFTHPKCGPVAMRLTPSAGTDMHGRDGFLIHGDSVANPGTASEGCPIMPRSNRTKIPLGEVFCVN